MKNVFRKSISMLLCAVLLATSFTVPRLVSYASENTAQYSVFVYEMDIEGNYGEPEITTYEAETGCTVNADTDALLKDGFSVDEENSILSAEVVADGSTVLAVYLMRNFYTFSLNYNGGKYGSNYEGIEKEYYYGEKISPVDLPCKTGCNFCGWVDENGNLIDQLPVTMPCSDLILTAVWEYIPYRLTFNANGGCFENGEYEILEDTYEYDTTVELYENPTRFGYTFMGWSRDSSASFPEYSYAYGDNVFQMPCEDVVLYAVWSVICWKVIWIVDGETWMESCHDYKSMVEKPYEDPVKPGYEFIGWADAEGNVFDDYYLYPMPAEDITFTAVFEPQEQVYSVEFYFEDLNGDYILDEGRTVCFEALTDESVAYAPEEIEGFTIDWDNSVTTMRVAGDEQTVLKIYYARNQYCLTFDACEGCFEYTDKTTIDCILPYGMVLPAVNTPERPGYVFCGWSEYPETMPAHDLTLYAVWEAMQYNAEWYADGELFCITVSNYSECIETPSDYPMKVGYIFLGWAMTEDSCTTVDVGAMTMPSNDMAFYAVFAPCEDTVYAVETYLMNIDGEYEYYTTEFCSGTSDAYVSFEPMAYRGFTFEPEISVTEGVIHAYGSLVLRLFYSRNQYVVNYDYGYDMISACYYYDATLTEPETPSQIGFYFDGWVDEDGNAVEFPYIMPDYDITFTARWITCEFTVHYDLNGGYFSDGEQDRTEMHEYGSEIYPSENPIREGYTFERWVNADTGEEIYFPLIMPAVDLNFRAEWVANMYTLRFADSDGYELGAFEIMYGEDITDLLWNMIPEKYGYTFTGWSMQQNSSYPDFSDDNMHKMPFYDLALYAVWSVNMYTTVWMVDGEVFEEIPFDFDSEILIPDHHPQKTGYEFIGWADDEGIIYTDNYIYPMPAEDITFNAVFTPCYDTPYTVEIYEMGIDGEYVLYTEVLTGTTDEEVYIDLNRYWKDGFEFDDSLSNTFGVIASDGSLVLSAYFERLSFELTYYFDSPEQENVTVSVMYEETIEPPIVFKEGYIFCGWTPQIPTVMPAQDITLTAVWEPMRFTVNWISEDVIIEQREYCYGEVIEIPDFSYIERPGYTFAGWNPYVPDTMPAYDLNITAVWELSGPVKHKVETYIMNTEGTYDMTASYHSAWYIGDVYTEPVVPEGFVLNEVSSILCGYADVYNELVLKVYLDRLPFEFTRIIDGKSYTTEYLYGSIIAEPDTPIKDGYIFTDWDVEIPDTMPANDVTVTANFRKITPADNVDHAISFYITPLNNVTLNYGESIKLQAYTKNLPEKFKIKWSVDSSCVTIKPSSNGKTCTVTATSSGGAAISAWIIDENGQKVRDKDGDIIKDTEVLYSEVNTWLIIVSFFKKLFKIDI